MSLLLLFFFSESRKANFTYKDGRIFSGNFVSGKVNNKKITTVTVFCNQINFILINDLSLTIVFWTNKACWDKEAMLVGIVKETSSMAVLWRKWIFVLSKFRKALYMYVISSWNNNLTEHQCQKFCWLLTFINTSHNNYNFLKSDWCINCSMLH